MDLSGVGRLAGQTREAQATQDSQLSTPSYGAALQWGPAKNGASMAAPEGKSLKQEGGVNGTGQHRTKERRETILGDLRYGARAGKISRKVIIEGRGGAARNNGTAPPATLDQAPGACAQIIQGGMGRKAGAKTAATTSKGNSGREIDGALHRGPAIAGRGDQNGGEGSCGDWDKGQGSRVRRSRGKQKSSQVRGYGGS